MSGAAATAGVHTEGGAQSKSLWQATLKEKSMDASIGSMLGGRLPGWPGSTSCSVYCEKSPDC